MERIPRGFALVSIAGMLLLLGCGPQNEPTALHPVVKAAREARDKVTKAAQTTAQKAHEAAKAIHENAPTTQELRHDIAAKWHGKPPPPNTDQP